MAGTLPSQLGRLTAPLYFYFDDTLLSGTLPINITTLANLSVLNLCAELHPVHVPHPNLT
jgi:hypothetical protein